MGLFSLLTDHLLPYPISSPVQEVIVLQLFPDEREVVNYFVRYLKYAAPPSLDKMCPIYDFVFLPPKKGLLCG